MREPTPHDLDTRLSVHEAVCAERYGQLLQRMGRLEKVIISVAAALLSAMALARWKVLPLLLKATP